jgi:hypothetical protein
MITIKAIDGKNGSKKPESIPTTKCGNHFDGTNFYFFESKIEAENFYASQPVLEQVPVKSRFIEAMEEATDKELDFLAKKLKVKLK